MQTDLFGDGRFETTLNEKYQHGLVALQTILFKPLFILSSI